MLNLLVASLSLVLPMWILLVIVMPVLMVLAYSGILDPLFSVGDADIQLFDFVLVAVILRTLATVAVRRVPQNVHAVYAAVGGFVGTMAIATLIAYYQFGYQIFVSEVIALSRFVAQVTVLPLIVLSASTPEKVKACRKALDYLGYAAVGLVYLNMLLINYGITVGEVQVTEEATRYFGLLGDQLGFWVLFFIYWKLIERRWLVAIIFMAALVATGTRGSLIALAVGMSILLWQRRGMRRVWFGTILTMLVVGVLVVLDVGGMRTRFIGPAFHSGMEQRILTMKLAVQVFLDHPLTGVGYTGFRYVAEEYGALSLFLTNFSPNFIATASNQYLQVATDGGVVGLASFTWLVFALLKHLKIAYIMMPNMSRDIFLAGYIWLLSLLIGNQTAAWLLPGSFISFTLWLVVGLAVAEKRLLKHIAQNQYSVRVQHTLRGATS